VAALLDVAMVCRILPDTGERVSETFGHGGLETGLTTSRLA
jgi:hypothetical protein